MFGLEIIEVVIFCGYYEGYIIDCVIFQWGQNGMLLCDNIFGLIEEDVQCCDFIINSFYYSVVDFIVCDYVGGMKDLQDGVICLIGNLEICYCEDLVCMLCVVCFVVKFNMIISLEMVELLLCLVVLFYDVLLVCLFEEVFKLLQVGYGYQIYMLLWEYSLFQLLFLIIICYFIECGDSLMEWIISQVLKNIDICIYNDMCVNLVFFFVVMFWYLLLEMV